MLPANVFKSLRIICVRIWAATYVEQKALQNAITAIRIYARSMPILWKV